MKKIMFSKEYGLQQAVLKNLDPGAYSWEKKNKTRRVCSRQIQDFLNKKKNGITMIPSKLVPADMSPEEFIEKWIRCKGTIFIDDGENGRGCRVIDMISVILEHSPYKVGEEVAIAQRYKDIKWNLDFGIKEMVEGRLMNSKGWTNKMFVFPVLMPHRIKILKVGVEKLQNISEYDCLCEGIISTMVKAECLNGACNVSKKNTTIRGMGKRYSLIRLRRRLPVL